jgi:hypothetical protein
MVKQKPSRKPGLIFKDGADYRVTPMVAACPHTGSGDQIRKEQ